MIEFADIGWDEDDLPYSKSFDDKYFCEEDGLAESRYIFCGGNHLSKRWKTLPKNESSIFTIGETGFGSGLNFLSAWELFEQTAPSMANLHYISLDQFPLSADNLSRALKRWPQMKSFSDQLIKVYSPVNVSQEMTFHNNRIRLMILFDNAADALINFPKDSNVNAWFLDGFAPAKNPDMWSIDVFKNMVLHSQPGTTLSTFAVAGFVRRGLMEAGFDVKKVQGFGRKRHMLEGILQND